MIRKDVLVKRPEGTKIYRQRNCEYVYHVTGSEYKKDKQYVVEKRVCIGKKTAYEKEIISKLEQLIPKGKRIIINV